MPAETTLKDISQPKDMSSKVWRYMDFIRFEELINNGKIFFNKANNFDDPFEGSLTKKDYKIRNSGFDKYSNSKELKEQAHTIQDNFREMIYINCWHMNEYESDAMWKLYTTKEESIAIQSTYEDLRDSFDVGICMGLIDYIDYEKTTFKEGSELFQPFMNKRKSFIHEQELRLLTTREHIKKGNGMLVDIDIKKLIHTIYIHPNSTKDFEQKVKELLKSKNYEFKIHKSAIYSNPIF